MGLNDFAVLALDDEPGNLSHLVKCLREIGIQKKIYTAPNGVIGLKLAKKYLPDLIITDWEMPEMNGIELIEKLKQSTDTSEIPIIMTTGVRMDSAELAIAFKIGVHDFLRKPYDILEFQARVQNALKLHSAQKDLRKTNDTLRTLNRARSRFFEDISHDLKTPIGLIIGQIELLLESHAQYLPDSTMNRLRKIKTQGSRLDRLSEEIRELVRLDEGRLKLNLQEVQLSSFLNSLVDSIQPIIRDLSQVDLSLECDDVEELWVSADPDRLEKVIYNLLANATTYSPENGLVTVTLKKHEQNALITVADQGQGIAPEVLNKIFDRFYGFGEEGGLGIGLNIVKELVELHHGKVEVESSNRGTRFLISIPCYEEGKAESPSTYKPSRSMTDYLAVSLPGRSYDELPSQEKLGNILVVDDHPDIRELLRNFLTDYRIIEASDGQEAYHKLQLYRIDLIITDLMMPVVDGFGLIENIQKNNTYANIPCLMLSSRFGEGERIRALELGVTDFMAKPFNPKELQLRVKSLLAKPETGGLPSVFEKYDLQEATRVTLERLESLVLEHLDNSYLGVTDLMDRIAVSERNLFRFFKDNLDCTPLDFIKKIRFEHVKNLLESHQIKSMSEAARSIGMSNVTNFRKQFVKQFGFDPPLKK
ncbi:MAG: response regulator [Cyclobacteriaceae bacterium]